MQEKCTIHKSKRSNTRKQTRAHKPEKEKWNGCSERGKRTLDLRIKGKMIEDDKREDKSIVSVV
jgi:hypothetical protein